MANKKQHKVCTAEGCEHAGAPQPIKNFGRSFRSKDGYMHRCRPCHGKAVSATRWRDRPPSDDTAKVANRALQRVNETAAKFLVMADDGDSIETANREKAVRRAADWIIEGYRVRVFREVQFELMPIFKD